MKKVAGEIIACQCIVDIFVLSLKGQGEKGQLIDKKSAKEPTQTKEKQQKSTAAVPAAKQNKFQDKKCKSICVFSLFLSQ